MSPRESRRHWTGRWPRPAYHGPAPGRAARARRAGARTSARPEKAARVADSALAAAAEAGDDWAMGWALHVLALVTGVQGHMSDALPLFDRARGDRVRSGPDLTCGCCCRSTRPSHWGSRPVRGGTGRRRASHVPRGPGRHSDPAGSGARRPCPVAVRNGPMDDALAEAAILPGELKVPAAACIDLGHRRRDRYFDRGETGAARRHLAAAGPHGRADRTPAYRPTGTRPQPGLRARRRAAGGARRADRGGRRQHRTTRGDRGSAGRRGSACLRDR